jgi:hypothetical protein
LGELAASREPVTELAAARDRVAYYRDPLGCVVAAATHAGTVFRTYDEDLPISESGPAGTAQYTPDYVAGETVHLAKEVRTTG